MPNYKLNYFNGRGRAELTRYIFAAAGAKYTDNRVSFDNWPSLKPEAPLGQMPYLEVDNQKLPQSIAIARFVAREFNLAGKNNLEQAQADAIVDTLMDLVNYYYRVVFHIKDADEKAEAVKKFLAEQGTKGAADVEKLISLYGSNGHSVGSELTWADLAIYDALVLIVAKLPDFAKNYPRLNEVYEKVAKHPKIVEYVKNRPETPF